MHRLQRPVRGVVAHGAQEGEAAGERGREGGREGRPGGGQDRPAPQLPAEHQVLHHVSHVRRRHPPEPGPQDPGELRQVRRRVRACGGRRPIPHPPRDPVEEVEGEEAAVVQQPRRLRGLLHGQLLQQAAQGLQLVLRLHPAAQRQQLDGAPGPVPHRARHVDGEQALEAERGDIRVRQRVADPLPLPEQGRVQRRRHAVDGPPALARELARDGAEGAEPAGVGVGDRRVHGAPEEAEGRGGVGLQLGPHCLDERLDARPVCPPLERPLQERLGQRPALDAEPVRQLVQAGQDAHLQGGVVPVHQVGGGPAEPLRHARPRIGAQPREGLEVPGRQHLPVQGLDEALALRRARHPGRVQGVRRPEEVGRARDRQARVAQ